MTSIGFNWNYGYQQNMQSSGLNYSGNSYFIQPQPQSLSGMGDPYDALSYGLGLIDSWSQPQQQYTFNQPQYNYNMNQNQTGFNSPFNYPQQQGDGSLASVLQSATAEYMMMMGQQMMIQQQLQGGINPADPMAMNKMLGAQMQRIGGDLRDDGIINGSNQRPNPMQMMMQMMQMFMQMIMSMLGLGQQQQQQQPQQQYINPNDPMAMNKMMGARMEQMGGDLRDDGILNGSNQRPNPMQMMQQMMGMFMQMMQQMLGMGQQQQQQPQQQFINPNDPMAMNKMLGAQMQRMGGDLRDDGILNRSNQRPQFPPPPMQMMQGMMMMFAGLDTIDNGQLDGSVFRNFMHA